MVHEHPIAAVFIGQGLPDRLRLHWFQVDIPANFKEILFVLDELRSISAFEQMAIVPMPVVEFICVDAQNLLHDPPQLGRSRLDCHVVMVAHEADRMHLEGIFFRNNSDDIQEVCIIRLIFIY